MTVPAPHQPGRWQAVEDVRDGLIDGCMYSCGCDSPGNPSRCIHVERFAALDRLQAALDAAERVADGMTPLRSLPGVEGTIGTDDLDTLRAALVGCRAAGSANTGDTAKEEA